MPFGNKLAPNGCVCCGGGGVEYPPSGVSCFSCAPTTAPITVSVLWRGGGSGPNVTTTDICVWTPAGTDPTLLASEFASPWATNPTYPLGPGPTCPQYRILGCALVMEFRFSPGVSCPPGSLSLTSAPFRTVSCTPFYSVTWNNPLATVFLSVVAHQ